MENFILARLGIWNCVLRIIMKRELRKVNTREKMDRGKLFGAKNIQIEPLQCEGNKRLKAGSQPEPYGNDF